MVIAIQKKCPDLSAAMIVNHEAWYKIYLELREKQRNSVKAWREQKEMKKKETIEAIKNAEDNINTDKTDTKKMDKLVDFKSKKVNDRKAQITRWKIEKENMRIADEECRQQQIQARQIYKDKQFKLRAMEIKNSLAKYKKQQIEKITKSLSDSSLNKNSKIQSAILLRSLRYLIGV